MEEFPHCVVQDCVPFGAAAQKGGEARIQKLEARIQKLEARSWIAGGRGGGQTNEQINKRTDGQDFPHCVVQDCVPFGAAAQKERGRQRTKIIVTASMTMTTTMTTKMTTS